MPGMMRRVLRDSGPGFCQFAITDACNANCAFCNFRVGAPRQSPCTFVDTDLAERAIDILAREGVGYLSFIGGEPALHASLPRLLARANRLGITTLVCTNGAALQPACMDEWARASIGEVIISIDAADAETHERNRGLPGVCERVAAANAWLRSMGIPTAASVTISRLLPDLDALPPFLESLGFDRVTFSYPVRELDSGYLAYSTSELIDYSNEELCRILEHVIRLKRRFAVLNPTESIRDMIRFLRGEKQRYACLAGYKYFYLHWNFDLYRCHVWHEPMCKIWDFGPDSLIRDGCTKCMIDCYRDASVLQSIAVAVHDSWRYLCRGSLGRAVGSLANRNSLGSFLALAERANWSMRLRSCKGASKASGTRVSPNTTR